MKILIDTSSLISLARYYLPFDLKKVLYSAVQNKIENKEILFLDKVYTECLYTSKGLVLQKLPFLKNRRIQVTTKETLPDQKFFNQLENEFINGSVKKTLDEVLFEDRKNKFLESADCKLLLYGLKLKNEGIDALIVSEETSFANDNKSFKKLPSICNILELKIITLPELLNRFKDINIEIK
ncbi:MAG: DUF4411 family protein [Ignavibacteriales bacterium]|nr:DUF4411 family protein [Ignavibacteriales bacterium]